MYYESELYHHGIKGQKWGVRRFQNPDGTFNEAGKARYFNSEGSKKGNVHRYLAKVNDINEATYKKYGLESRAEKSRMAKEAHLQKADAADKRKEANRPENRLKNAKNFVEAERALKAQVRSDLRRNQNPMKRAISTITGKNALVAEDLVKKMRFDTMIADGKDARSKMSTGQKFVDTLSAGNVERYTSSGYKNLGSTYDAYKSKFANEKKAMKNAERYSRRQELNRYMQKERNERMKEQNRQHTQAMIDNTRKRKELGLI